jgi:hypothetical protein
MNGFGVSRAKPQIDFFWLFNHILNNPFYDLGYENICDLLECHTTAGCVELPLRIVRRAVWKDATTGAFTRPRSIGALRGHS